jgi:hypothetical protein
LPDREAQTRGIARAALAVSRAAMTPQTLVLNLKQTTASLLTIESINPTTEKSQRDGLTTGTQSSASARNP